jgi:hypothetical protein
MPAKKKRLKRVKKFDIDGFKCRQDGFALNKTNDTRGMDMYNTPAQVRQRAAQIEGIKPSKTPRKRSLGSAIDVVDHNAWNSDLPADVDRFTVQASKGVSVIVHTMDDVVDLVNRLRT